MSRILVAMSGGVDSSVAALLMQRQGFTVIGLTALLFGDASAAGPCCGREGAASAAAVCAQLGIEHRRVDLSELFERQVIERFISEYRAGRTPNPCSDCNRFIKFDKFFKLAREWDCELLATGHYARIVERTGGRASLPALNARPAADPERPETAALPPHLLAAAVDSAKDQSYFLACIPAERLSLIRFPLGELSKPQVRAIAAEAGLPTAQRADSQDVCFMANRTGLAELLSWHHGELPQRGPIVDEDGRVLGEHPGAVHFTVGQRKGLRLGGGSEGLVVHRIEPQTNTVVVAQQDAHPIAALHLSDVVDMAPGLWAAGESAMLRCRYRQPLWPGRIVRGSDDSSLSVVPVEPQYGAAPGQWCAAYREGIVLFGGIINEIEYQK